MRSKLLLARPFHLVPLLRKIESEGISSDKYLRRFGLSKDLFFTENTFISKKYHVWDLLACITKHEGIDDLGIRMDSSDMSKDIGMSELAVMNSTTLFEAISGAMAATAFYIQNESARFTNEGELTHIDFVRPEGGYCPIHEQLAVKFVLFLLSAVSASSSYTIQLQQGEPNCNGFKKSSIESVEFNTNKTRISLPSHLLSLSLELPPVQQTEEVTFSETLDSQSLSQSLRSIVNTLLTYNFKAPTVYEAAEMVGVSRKTLYLNLATEGSSYKKILKDAIYQRAHFLITKTELSIKEISQMMGYANQNSFSRAFCSQAGIPPRTLRNHLRGS